jgi:hypothetical protein
MIDFQPYFATDHAGTAYAPLDGFRGYREIPEPQYHRLPAISATTLKCPTAGHMLDKLTAAEVDVYDNAARAEAFTMGRLVHWAALEPHKLRPDNHLAHMVASPTDGLGTKAARATRDANPGKLLVTPDHIRKAVALLDAIQGHPEASHWLSQPGERECSGLIRSGGVWRKWRADLALRSHRAIVDVKTTRHCVAGARGVRKWISECWDMGYWIQAAWYLHHHELATGMRPGSFVFVVVSTGEPFHARCFEVENVPTDAAHYHPDMPLAKARRILGLDPGDEGITRLDMFLKSARETAVEQAAGRPLTPAILRQLWPITEDDTSTVQINLPPSL